MSLEFLISRVTMSRLRDMSSMLVMINFDLFHHYYHLDIYSQKETYLFYTNMERTKNIYLKRPAGFHITIRRQKTNNNNNNNKTKTKTKQ